MTQSERITALEVQVAALREELRQNNTNLQELLALRNKGAGIFWLMSVLFGAAMVGWFSLAVSWLKHGA